MEGLARRGRATTVASLALLASLTLVAGAAAQTPPVPTPPAPAPAPPPAPVTARLGLKVTAKHHDGRRQVALRGEKLLVSGRLTPFVAGQTVTVRVRDGRRTVLKRKVAVGQAPDGRGVYAVALRVRRTGWLTVRAAHAGTPQLATTRSNRGRLLVATPRLGYGSSGALVRIFQRRLRALRYPTGVTGAYDAATGRAVLTWRKVNGRPRVESADGRVVRGVLLGRGGWKVRHPGAGHHVEADISRQALALIDGDRVQHVYMTSSGAPATPTVIGQFRFYLKTPGTNAKGMVDSNYFIRGYAIHGYVSVPTYNASHGCLRVPIANARTIYDWVRIGDRIFVEP
jgi:hypothetical protein